MPMVSTKKPNRKIAILVIRPPKGRGRQEVSWCTRQGCREWAYCPPGAVFDTEADDKEKTVSDARLGPWLRPVQGGGFFKLSPHPCVYAPANL